MANGQSNKPVARYRSWGIEVAVWEQDENKFSITVKKTYRNKDSNTYEQTNTFFPEELPRLAMVVQKAYEFCNLQVG